MPIGSCTWVLNGSQVGGALAIVFLTLINYIGVKEGAGVQNAVTAVKIGSIVVLALRECLVRHRFIRICWARSRGWFDRSCRSRPDRGAVELRRLVRRHECGWRNAPA